MKGSISLRGEKRSGWRQWVLVAPFLAVSLDAWINYFLSNHFVVVRVGYFSLLALVMTAVVWGRAVFNIPIKWLFGLGVLCLSLLIGVVSAPDIGLKRLFEIAGIIIYFFCGYTAFRWLTNPLLVQRAYILIGILYVPVCVVALLRLWPSLFPVTEALWSQRGVLQVRPEVMTDQNFQVFYLLPIALAMTMPLSLNRGMLLGVLSVGALYVLAQLQTRSGFISFALALMLGLSAAIRNKSMGRKKVVLLPLIAVLATLFALPAIIEQAGLLIYRFTGHGYGTALGRVGSFTYMLDRLFDPAWWIPRGNKEFLDATGNVPHTNMAAFYLEGGLIGLLAWLQIIVAPALALAFKVFKGGLDPVAVTVGCGGVGVLILQLTLNVPAHSQVWLWAGGVVGVLERLRRDEAKRRQKLIPQRVVYEP